MRLCRYGSPGVEKPGFVDEKGRIRALSAHCADIDANILSHEGLERLRSLDHNSLPEVSGETRLGPPVSGISKFICIGLNYSDHAAEAGLAIPSEPIIFLKANSAICGPNEPTIKPKHSTKLDYEVELGVVIGQQAKNVSRPDAMKHVAGYCVVNDVSERAFQMQSSQWDKGKGCDTFGPIGPWLVTAEEIPDPQNLNLWLDVNGKRMQTGNTKSMIFGVEEIVSYVSHYMTLLPGDVIATGTPPGVGMGIKPEPFWLNIGDNVSLGIDGLGSQSQKVVSE